MKLILLIFKALKNDLQDHTFIETRREKQTKTYLFYTFQII